MFDEGDGVDCFRSKRKDRAAVFRCYLNIFVSFKSFNDILLGFKDAFGFGFVTIDDVLEHGGPGASDDGARSAAGDAGGGVDASFPLCVDV